MKLPSTESTKAAEFSKFRYPAVQARLMWKLMVFCSFIRHKDIRLLSSWGVCRRISNAEIFRFVQSDRETKRLHEPCKGEVSFQVWCAWWLVSLGVVDCFVAALLAETTYVALRRMPKSLAMRFVTADEVKQSSKSRKPECKSPLIPLY